MRILPAIACLSVAAVTFSACIYVDERPAVRERPATVQTVPGATVVTPGAAPAAPPAAVIVR
jgi:hypothetical protein